MKTLYIHGLDSFPVPEKIEILTKAGLDVVSPHIDWRNDKNIYQNLKARVQKENVEFLVGSSLGGYAAHWLAEDLGLPCLLFNPAMSFSVSLDKFMPEISNRLCPARFVAIGAHDATVDPVENISYFRERENDFCYQRVIVCQWLGHQIDFDSFDTLVRWALRSYQNKKTVGDNL